MFKKVLSLVLAGSLMGAFGISPAYADSKKDNEARFTEKVRAGVSKLGIGEAARVDIKLRDKTRLKGYIKEAGADSFVLIDAKTGTATTIAYPEVTQVKGNNLATGGKIAIGVGIALGVLLLIYLIGVSSD
jgi:hypothetical protein